MAAVGRLFRAYGLVQGKLGDDSIFEENAVKVEAYESERDITRAVDGYQADSQEERELVRKIDWKLLPILSIVYATQSMDKAGINGTTLAGKARQLYNSNTAYSSMIQALAIGYVVLVIGSNMLLSRSRPSRFLPGLLLATGLWSTLTNASMSSSESLLMARVPLIITEALVFPAILYILSCWYKPGEIGKRIALFPVIAILTQALSSAIQQQATQSSSQRHSHSRSISASRMVFMVDGILTILAALLAAMVLPNYPATTRSLSRRERELATVRLLADGQDTGSSTSLGIERLSHLQALFATVRDPRVLLFAALNFLTVAAGSISHLVTSQTAQFAYTSIRAHHVTGLVSAAALLLVLVSAILSDRSARTRGLLVVAMLLAATGPIASMTSRNPMKSQTGIQALFTGAFIAAIWAMYPLLLSWLTATIRAPAEKRAVALALVHAVGGLASVYGARMWPRVQGSRARIDAAMAVTFLTVAVVVTLVVPTLLPLQNYRGTGAERALRERRRARDVVGEEIAVEEVLQQ